MFYTLLKGTILKKNYNARRRGTSVAAAALSFALVAPLAQSVAAPGSATAAFASTKDGAGQDNAENNGVKYPGVNADGIYQTSVGEPRYTFEPPKKKAGTIESGTTQDDTDSIQGFVLNTRNGNMAINPDTENYRPIPMEGVRVYAEWVDKDGYTSPTYTTVTGPDGRYAIKMRPFFDALGGEHKFDADPNLPEGEKIRVWAVNPDGETFQQVYGYNNGFLGPQANTIDTQGTSTQWLVGENRVNNVRFFYGEKPQNDVMHKVGQAVENPANSSPGGQVQGKLFWEQDHTQGAFTWNLMNTLNSGDVAAEGMKVYGSYLSDYAINKIKNEAPAAIGVDEIPDGANGRSPDAGWTRDDEAALQNWIKREMAADTEKDPVTGKFGKDRWIAETVMATVGADNDYTLQFNGTFGQDEQGDRGTGGSQGNPLTRNDGTKVSFPDGSEHVAWDLLGTVAPDPDYGTFRKGALGNESDKMPKHVNWDWLFVSTEDVPGFGVQTPWQTNGYLDHWRYNTGDGWNVVKMGEHLRTSFLSLYADYVTFDVTPYDTAENWAKPGDVAETKTNGVPTQFVDNLNYEIEWVNADTGEVVDTSPLLKAGPKGELPSFPLDTGDEELFPNGIDKTTTFRADLYPVDINEGNARGSRIAADSFTVLVGWAPIYEEEKGKAGEPLESGVPTFDNTTTDEVESEKGSDLPSPVAKFELPETFQVPEGYTIELDETTGEVTLTFPKDAKPGTKFEVPVVAVLEDGTRTVGSAPFEVVVDTNTTVEPKYEDKKVVPGTPAESEPTFKKQDEDGNVTEETVDAPEGSKFSIPEDFEAPEGYTVDEETGVITVTAPEQPGAETAEEFDVPVTVTYPDGSTDNATAKFKLDTDGDGIPDVTDEDDDNDGFTDEEEKDAGTNPKDPSESPAKAALEDKTVVEGKPVDPVKVDTTVPAEGSVEVTGLPEGLIYNPETGQITGTPTKLSDWGKDEETREFPVTVEVKDKDDKVVATDKASWTVQRDTDGDGDPDVTDEDDDNDGFTDEEEKEAGTDPKDPNSKPETPVDPDASVVTDPVTVVEGQETDPFDTADNVPEGGKVSVDNLPGGLEVDPETGKVTGTPDNLDDWGKDEEERDVTVTVTITDADGNEVAKEDKVITVQRDTDGDGDPDVTDEDDDNDGFTDEEEKEAGTDPKDPESKPSEGDGVQDTTPPTVNPITEGDKTISGTGDRPNEDIIVTLPDGTKVETTTDENGNWSVDVPADVELKDGDKVVVTDGDGNKTETTVEAGDVKDTTPPTVDAIKPGDKTISGTGDRPNEKIIVELPDGTKVETETDKDGKWIIEVPAGVELKPGDKVIVSDGAGNSTTEQVGIDTGKCVATSLGFGLPLLALIPLGLATQMEIPGLSTVVADANAQLQAANTQIQQQLGLFNPGIAAQVDAANRQLAQFGTDLGTVAGGLALIAAGILAGTLIYDNCSPNGGGSSVKDLELKGSTGKTYAGSSEKK